MKTARYNALPCASRRRSYSQSDERSSRWRGAGETENAAAFVNAGAMEAAKQRDGLPASPWTTLEREFDAWTAAGRTATLWWRDDDATRPGPALDRLFKLRRDLPLAVAAIPAGADTRLADRLAKTPGVDVIQHGYSHRNHARPGAKKSELPGDRPLAATLGRLADGRRKLARLFGQQFVPVLAPPWNRIDRTVIRSLRRAGLRAVSGFGAPEPAAGVIQINTHLDPIDWRGSRGFIGEAAALNALAAHLRLRRQGRGNPALPSGLLTHHRDNDAAVWRFLEALVETTHGHPAVRWISIREHM